MKNLFRRLSLAFVLGLVSNNIYALSSNLTEAELPLVYSNCNHIKVNNPDNSSGVEFSQDCKTLYVLPPLKLDLEITSFNFNIAPKKSEQICNEIEVIGKKKNHYLEKRLKLTTKLNNDLVSMETELDRLFKEKKYTELDALEEKYKITLDKHHALLDVNSEIISELFEREASYSNKYGAEIKFVITDEHDSLVAKYKEINPRLDVIFKKMEVQSVLAYNHEKDGESDYIFPTTYGVSLGDSETNQIKYNGFLDGSLKLTTIALCNIKSVADQKKQLEISVVINRFDTYTRYSSSYTEVIMDVGSLISDLQKQVKSYGKIDDLLINNFDNFYITELSIFDENSNHSREHKKVKKDLVFQLLFELLLISKTEGSYLSAPFKPFVWSADNKEAVLKNCFYEKCDFSNEEYKALTAALFKNKYIEQLKNGLEIKLNGINKVYYKVNTTKTSTSRVK